MKQNILEVKSLRKQFEHFRLNDVSFSIPQGYIMGFIGPNGAGKTTTIKTILGALRPDGGSVRVFGQPFGRGAVALREEIGIVMDTPLYPEHWTVAGVEQTLAPFYQNWDTEGYARLCRNFLLDPTLPIKALSRGMKVKLQIAIALSHGARLLIMDEPTSGLDPVARDDLVEILLDFISDEECGVLFSTHITSDLEKLADYITYIKDGSIVYTGEKEGLLGRYALIKGGPEDLNDAMRRRIIGLREYGFGFEGMLPLAERALLSPGAEECPISLDQIIVFMNKEGRADE